MHMIDMELNTLMLRERLNEAEKERRNRELLRYLRRENRSDLTDAADTERD